MTPFERKVLTVVSRIPVGNVTTYGDVARLAGRPGAARAVGNAMSRNPVPIVVPCHRVIAAGGRIGGYGASGVSTKRRLLALEGRNSDVELPE
jgi:methylated-DNA-[protein]-cysteine S-methyltransferase